MTEDRSRRTADRTSVLGPPTSDLGPQPSPAGIYIHIPFCRAKCPYCDFYSITTLDRIDAYHRALLVELETRRHQVPLADTIYFGGGTPSVLTPSQISRLIDAVGSCFRVAADAEVTLEVNPGTVAPVSLADYRKAGVNRLNIGLQSVDNRTLSFLGRIHTAEEGFKAYNDARDAGFTNIGLDLIYAVPGQTVGQWQRQMAAVVQLEPDHLSCYTLTLEPGTPMQQQAQTGRVRLPDEKTVGDLFAATAPFLNTSGYRQYEISNYARLGAAPAIDYRSRHNRKYWNFSEYLGFGPGAHSYREPMRWWNHRDLEDYIAALTRGRSPAAGREELTREQQIMEAVYLGLRQTDGIDAKVFRSRFGVDLFATFGKRIAPLMRERLLEKKENRLRLTARGMLLLESVVGRILA